MPKSCILALVWFSNGNTNMESAECKLSDLGPSPGEPDFFMSDFHLTYKTSHEKALYNELLCNWTRDVRREMGVSGKAIMIFR